MVRALACLLSFALGACAAVESEPGLASWLRVRGGRYVEGKLPETTGGPEIVALRVPHAAVLPGLRRELLSGSLAPDTTAVVLGLDGDRGYYIVIAGAPSIEEPAFPTFAAELSFARATPVGPQVVAIAAVRADGAVGPRRAVLLDVTQRARSEFLSIELRWDNEADLDLHVVLPDGVELGPDNNNAYTAPPPGAAAPDPSAYLSGAALDLDSNANCLIDGRREERASWPVAASAGSYVVRVATASLCAASVAHWTVVVWRGGTAIQRAEGTSQSVDARFGSAVGAGALALQFSLP